MNKTILSSILFNFVVIAIGDAENARITFETAMLDAGAINTTFALLPLNDANDYDFGIRVFVDCGDGDSFFDLTIADQRFALSFLSEGDCG
jgi:hypothetical protein